MTVLVALPILASRASPILLARTRCKNNAMEKQDVPRFAGYLLGRTLPTAVVVVLVRVVAFGAYVAHFQSNTGDVPSDCEPGEQSLRWCDLVCLPPCLHLHSSRSLLPRHDLAMCSHLEPDRATTFRPAHVSSAALGDFLLGASLAAQSAGFLYRTDSMLAMPPWHNKFWLGGALVAVVLQAVLSAVQLFEHAPSVLEWVPWELWLVVALWPLLSAAIGEKVKASDAEMYERDMKFLQLDFNTRLGMYSPR